MYAPVVSAPLKKSLVGRAIAHSKNKMSSSAYKPKSWTHTQVRGGQSLQVRFRTVTQVRFRTVTQTKARTAALITQFPLET